MGEPFIIYFYDKTTGHVVHMHRHSIRGQQVDCDDKILNMLLDQTGSGGAYEFLPQKVTDQKIENLGYTYTPLLITPMSYLKVDEAADKKLVPKPYIHITVNSPDATYKETKKWGYSSQKDFWEFPADGIKGMDLKVELRCFKDETCQRSSDDAKESKIEIPELQFRVSHGKLCNKHGRYDLKKNKTQCAWTLPDTSFDDAQVFAGDTHVDYVKSKFIASNTINVRAA